jgi:succinate-semialdehyde dehydrogenase/glutarate-semialdehyde dehydrogenase
MLKDATLLRDQAYCDGAWVNAQSGKRFAVTDPASGLEIGSVPDMDRDDALAAVASAEAALPAWRALTAKQRSAILRAWNDLILANAGDLAALLTAEQGKPLAEAKGEIIFGAAFVEWFAEEAKRVYGDTIPAHGPDKRIIVQKQPVGIVAAVTPWNFPNAMITRKVAPALAVGCTVIVKPAEDTPLSALALAVLAERAGMPKGVLNVVTAKAPAGVGSVLTGDSRIRKFSFTGSTEVGKLLMKQCADTVKKVSLELGGNAPFIVFDDRFLVQEGIYDAFAAKLAQKVQKMKVGPGAEAGVTTGPLINQEAIEKVERLVKDATSKGAKALTGGRRHALGGTFYEPTILTGVDFTMACASEEIFGPVAPLFRFKSEADAIRIANSTPFGLAAYFYARDIGRIMRVAEALDFGMVGINEGMISTEVAPFGGIKESGFGREGSKYGIEDFLDIKYLCLGGL